ncbi:hypothetical protein CG740_19015 [Streptomyces sp. CB01201]|uniref:hypothetical protein n=1 Tax=Streptomyces sp. CB01201 TaxID=2020324 RepID=UPI000CCAF5EC|nr:hypothetical protein [Streptomyces sp. CB01201]PJN01849.1 hypothetical protein CG740_19015 [Streptomyces sp. CB01201]
MRPLVIVVLLIAATLPFAPDAVNFDKPSGVALMIAWGVGCGLFALLTERLIRASNARNKQSER